MRKLMLAWVFGTVVTMGLAETYEFSVVRDKFLRDESGQLTIDDAGLAYRSDNGKTSFRIDFEDIRLADVSDPNSITVKTYDLLKRRLLGNRTFTFRLKDGVVDDKLARFFAEKLPRPLVGDYEVAAAPGSQVPVYHRHRFGGCHGTLWIASKGIRFESDKTGDSRTWVYPDIETIGRPDPFRFRVTTLAETYTFDLKRRMPEDLYRLAWREIYGL